MDVILTTFINTRSGQSSTASFLKLDSNSGLIDEEIDEEVHTDSHSLSQSKITMEDDDYYESDGSDYYAEYDSDNYEYESGSDGDGDAAMVPSPFKRVESYRVLKEKEVQVMKEELIADCADTLGLTDEQAHIHLAFYKWNIRKLQEDWFDRRGKVTECVPCSSLSSDTGAHAPQDGTGRVECPACFMDFPASEMVSLPCGHGFCSDCWSCYTTEALKSDGVNCVVLSCMGDGCKEAIGPEFFKKCLDPSKRELYNRYLLQSFCNNNKDIAWCPSPGCSYIISYPGGGRNDIDCICGHKFCFNCVEDAHRPASCEDVAKWAEKNSAESENVTWILANTKKCPKCRKPIEKNQGCNHMTCHTKVGGCGHEFCWLCLGDWKEHGQETGGFYRCNKYEKAKANGDMKKAEDDRQNAKHQLEKYMHYFQRFMNHKRSLRFGENTLKVIEEKMELLLAQKNYKITEVDFLRAAGEQVIECRRVLQWTYVFGYYLNDGPEKTLFEYLQENLEKDTETLHELVESPLDQFLTDEATKSDFFQHRSNVTNYAAVTAKFRQNLLEGVENGLTDELPLQHQPFKRART